MPSTPWAATCDEIRPPIDFPPMNSGSPPISARACAIASRQLDDGATFDVLDHAERHVRAVLGPDREVPHRHTVAHEHDGDISWVKLPPRKYSVWLITPSGTR